MRQKIVLFFAERDLDAKSPFYTSMQDVLKNRHLITAKREDGDPHLILNQLTHHNAELDAVCIDKSSLTCAEATNAAKVVREFYPEMPIIIFVGAGFEASYIEGCFSKDGRGFPQAESLESSAVKDFVEHPDQYRVRRIKIVEFLPLPATG